MVARGRLSIDTTWRQTIKWGGASLFAAAVILFVFVVGVLVSGQAMPPSAEGILQSPVVPSTLFVLVALGELLLMPAALSLYFALGGVRRAHMILAAGLMLACVPMFLASRGLVLSVARMSGGYLSSTSEVARAAYLVAGELALEAQTVLSATGLILLCASSILAGTVMLKGGFAGRIGYLVIVAGAISILSPFAVVLGIPLVISFIGLLLMGTWQLIVGAKLYRLGRDGT